MRIVPVILVSLCFFGCTPPVQKASDPAVVETNEIEEPSNPLEDSAKISQQITDLIQKQDKQIRTKLEGETLEKGMVIRLDSSVLFSAGQVRLKPISFDVLDDIGKLIRYQLCEVGVEAHVESTAYIAEPWASPWDLSAVQAVSVLRYLVEIGGIIPKRIRASGFGDMRPIEPNENQASGVTNNRVEIVCHPPIRRKP